MNGVSGILYESGHNEQYEHADFNHGHQNLQVARGLNTLDHHRADQCQPACCNPRDCAGVVGMFRADEQQCGRRCGCGAGHHEDRGSYEQRPARDEPGSWAEDLPDPTVGGPRIGDDPVQMHERERHPEHDQAAIQERTGRQ